MKKIWCAFCVIFCAYSLSNLLDEAYEITYLLEDRPNPIRYSCCTELSNFYATNETEIDLTRLRSEIYDQFNRSEPPHNEDDQQLQNETTFNDIENYFFNLRKKYALNLTASGSYHLHNKLICWVVNNFNWLAHLKEFLNKSTTLYEFDEETLDSARMNDFYDSYDQLVVLRKGQPYSDCSPSNSKFHCLNECFKRRYRLASYFYLANETGSIQLNGDTNRTVKENEESCFKECNKENCKMTNFIPNAYFFWNFKTHTFKAYPTLDGLDYWLQVTGLLCLFFNLSFFKLLLLSFRSIDSKVTNDRTRRCLPYLKFATVSVGVLALCGILTKMMLDYKEQMEKPIRKATAVNRIEPDKRIELVICVPVILILMNETRLPQYNYIGNRTFAELEKRTEGGLNFALETIEMDYQNQSTRENYARHPKVIFRYSHLGIMRCFPLTVYPTEHLPRYQSLIAISKLKINFKFSSNNLQLFLLTSGEKFDRQSFLHLEASTFRLNITERSRSSTKEQCVDYAERYVALNCTSRTSCVDLCLSRKFVARYQNISVGIWYTAMVIDKEHYTPFEWENLFPVGGEDELHRRIFEELLHDCEKEIVDLNPCNEIKFELVTGIRHPDDRIRELDLFYEVYQSAEEEPSSYKLILNFLTVQSCLFGFTIFGLLRSASVKLKVGENKLTLPLIYFFCSLGFACQTLHALDMIINGPLSKTQHYATLRAAEMPLIIFCFSFNTSLIDPNRKLTGGYLEQLTRELSAETIFNNVSYLNDSADGWCSLDRKSIKFFFFLDKKCFTLKTGVREYPSRRFFFLRDKQVLRVNLNRTWLGAERVAHFMTQSATNSMHFSKISSLVYKHRLGYADFGHSISQELFVVRREDKFLFLRHPFSSFRGQNDLNDIRGYLVTLLRNYKENHHLVTAQMPIRESLFDFEIDDELFRQYYSQVQNVSDHDKPASQNFRREFAINTAKTLERYEWDPSPKYEWDFSFSLNMFRKVIVETNPDGYGHSKLILNLLNLLSVWFDLAVVDLWTIFCAPKHFLLFFYAPLVRARGALCQSIVTSKTAAVCPEQSDSQN